MMMDEADRIYFGFFGTGISKTCFRDAIGQALDLLGRESNWTQGNEAVDDWSSTCDANDPDACKWCITGAVAHVIGNDFESESVQQIIRKLDVYISEIVPWTKGNRDSAMAFNDHSSTDHRDILDVLETVMEKASDPDDKTFSKEHPVYIERRKEYRL